MENPSVELQFLGYWRAVYLYSVPLAPGIFCVYSCTNNVANSTVTLHDLLYIGESENVRMEIHGHRLFNSWLAVLRGNEELCFSYAQIDTNDDEEIRKSIANTLIRENEPKFPETDHSCSEKYPFRIVTRGANWKIKPEMNSESILSTNSVSESSSSQIRI